MSLPLALGFFLWLFPLALPLALSLALPLAIDSGRWHVSNVDVGVWVGVGELKMDSRVLGGVASRAVTIELGYSQFKVYD